MAIFETVRHWRSSGVYRREIARRLNINIKTVRRTLLRIDGGATAPTRISKSIVTGIGRRARRPGAHRLGDLRRAGADPEFDASYAPSQKALAPALAPRRGREPLSQVLMAA